MAAINVFVLVLVWCIAFGTNYALDLDSALENVPEGDRMDFLKFHVNLGYKLANARNPNGQKAKDYKMGLPNSFSEELYEYILKNHEIKNDEFKKALFEIVCFDDGTCIDIGDVGVHPTII